MWQFTLLAIVVVWIWKVLREQANHPLGKVAGPPRVPIAGSAFFFFGMSNRDLFDLMSEFPKKYGARCVVKAFNRYILHVYNVDDVEDVCDIVLQSPDLFSYLHLDVEFIVEFVDESAAVLSHSKNITKNKPYRFLEPWLGTGLLLSTGSKWHKRRKILTPSFHFNILKHFNKVMEKNSQNMVDRLKETIKNGSDVIDVIRFTSDCTLCIICETAMGTQLDSDKSAATVEYKQEITSIGSIIMQRLTRHWLHINFVFEMSSLGKRFAKCLVKVQSFCDDVILKRKMEREKEVPLNVEDDSIGSKRRLALLDLLLEEESKGEIDLEGIREEVNTFMFEGHDTTAMALTFGLMLLADHEEVQERIFEECQSILGDSERTCSLQEQAEMKYLEAVIKEILRLYPSVPFIGRQVTEEFVLDGGLVVPKDSEVLVHIHGLHRRADIYPEPEEFKPERFLGTENRHPYAFVPFSAGPRNCIGRRFAMQEMKCFLCHVVRNFKLAPVKKGARPALVADIILRPSEPIYVKLIPR